MPVSRSEQLVLRHGHAVPVLGFAARAISDPAEAYDATSIALAAGYRSVLTAPEGRNEESVGLAIRDSRLPPSTIRVSTALATSAWSTDDVTESVESSLEALGVDELDVVVMTPARPSRRRRARDDDRRWRVLEYFHEELDVRALGLSGYSARDLMDLARRQEVAPHLVELHDGLDERDRAAVRRWSVARAIAIRRPSHPAGGIGALPFETTLERRVGPRGDRDASIQPDASSGTEERSIAARG